MVSEVVCPKRQRRACCSKSDNADVARATAIVLAGATLSESKSSDGVVEIRRVL